MQLGTFQWNTIRIRLWVGFGILVALLLAAGIVARRAFAGMSTTISASLSEVQAQSQLASQLSADVAKTIEAGSRYIDTRDSTAQDAFRQYGWSAHDIQGRMNDRPGQSAMEVATIASIDDKLSAMEVDYALAHRLADLGRTEQARRVAGQARGDVDALLSDIQQLGTLKAQSVARAKSTLSDETDQRSAWLIGLIALALMLGILVVLITVRHIGEPLDVLVQHAQRLSAGDLASRTIADMPGEFSILAAAMNQTGESLSRIVGVAARTAESVSSSAHDLASVSEDRKSVV